MENLELKFTKMQAAGNDYIYIDGFNESIDIESTKPYIKYMCDRNFGVGSDGVIFILPSEISKAKMIMYNKDGTEADICGNGIYCVAKYLYESGITKNEEFEIEAKAGVKNIKLHLNLGNVEKVSLNMGYPNFNPHAVPVITEKSFFLNESVVVQNENYNTTCVSVGNPHAVVFTKYIKNLKLHKIGPEFETHYLFPERINIEFVEKINEHSIKMRTWERGAGETLSSGSGACASVAAAVMNGELRKNQNIQVIQKGGTLDVEYNDQEGMILTGNAEKIYDGKILLKKKTSIL